MRWLCLLAFVLTACAAPASSADRQAGPVGEPQGPWREQTHWIPLTPPNGAPTLLLGRVCRPAGDAPARVVVIAHGAPPDPARRPRMQLTSCDSEAVRWFLQRGYVVVLSMRRGYGGTGGTYMETSTGCSATAYANAARVAAQDLAATVAYGLSLPYARHDGAVLVGQSAGGWSALGFNAQPHPGVIAVVSMAGGRGGHMDQQPNQNCHAENLAAAAGELGRTAATPMLWVYTANDSFFAPQIAQAMHTAYVGSGGKADLHQLPAFGNDGHNLFFGRGGSQIWGPLIAQYLQQQGAT